MAKVIKIDKDFEVVVAVQNIGFINGLKDLTSGGTESNGYEDLIEETIVSALSNMSKNFEVVKMDIKPIDDKNVLIEILSKKI